jgi:hypothetical protein
MHTLMNLSVERIFPVSSILVNVWTRIKTRQVECNRSIYAKVEYIEERVPADKEQKAFLFTVTIWRLAKRMRTTYPGPNLVMGGRFGLAQIEV